MSTAVFLSLRLGLPLLLEGEPGVGKTAAAQVLAAAARRTAGAAAVLRGAHRERGALRLELPAPAAGDPDRRVAATSSSREADLFSEEYLIERPILRCVRYDGPHAAGAADRRGRPGRRRVRGAPARGARRGLGDRARARHVHGRCGHRSWCSPPTAAATCTTRCVGAACTTGWSTPSRSACVAILRRTVPDGQRGPDRVGRAVRRPRARRWTWTSRRGWPRRSTGSRRSPRSARPSWCATRWSPPRARSPRPPTTATCGGSRSLDG